MKVYEHEVSDSKKDQEITVFISYAREDSDAANRLCQDLKNAGLTPWLDKDSLISGQDWKLAINKAIHKSTYFIPMFSSSSVIEGRYVQEEFKYALDVFSEFPQSRIFGIFPVRLDDCDIPYEKLNNIHRVDLFRDWNQGLQKIAQDMKQMYPQISGGKYRKPYSTLTEIMIDRLDTDDGIDLDVKKLNILCESCFDDSDIYCGTDTNIPSRLIGNLRSLFEEHKNQQIKNNKTETSRILIVDEIDLNYDYQVNYKEFVRCYREHKDHNISLYQVDRNTAKERARNNRLPADVIEVSIWKDKYAIQWKPPNGDSSRRISFGFAEDRRNNRYSKCVDYFESLMERSKRIDVVEQKSEEVPETKKLRLVPFDTSRRQNEPTEHNWREPINTALDNPDIVTIWKDFVNCKERIKRTGKFLSRHLKDRKKILDAAAGVGCETVYLAEKGYDVTSNEGSVQLLNLAREYARKRYQDDIKWRSYDWRVMAFEFNMREFDAVLVLGNFISLIYNEEDRKRCLDQFYKILKPGGILIIDQRNYRKIFENRDKIEADPDYFYKNNYSGGNLYCGRKVRGWPHKIQHDKIVTFRYAENPSSVPNAEISLYMFEGDELKELLEEEVQGFINIKRYSDYNLKPEVSENADFFTYVAEKPRIK